MKMRAVAAMLVAGLMPQGLGAVELTGANVDVSHYQFTNNSKGTRQALRGSFEVGFGDAVATQVDLGYYKFGQSNTSANAATVHGIYNFNYDGAIGAFWGTENEPSLDRNFYGLEATYDFANVGVEGYFSRGKVNGQNATMLGGVIDSDVGDRLNLRASVDWLDNNNGANMTRLAVGADYDFGSGVSLYGEFGGGNARVSNSSSNDAFVGFGLKFNLGEKPGTTFDRRAIIDRLPGL
jgi:Gram-negative porin